MAAKAGEASQTTAMASPDPSPFGASSPIQIRSRPDSLLLVFRCFSLITAVAAVLCVVVNGISGFLSFKHGPDVFGGIFRCYAVVIALLVVVTETEWSLLFKFWKVLEYWVGRSMLQIFVAVMTRAFSDVHGEQRNIVLLQEIASYMLLACGVAYFVGGILCLGCLKRSRQHKEITRDQAIKDLEELERRREELESLLVRETP